MPTSYDLKSYACNSYYMVGINAPYSIGGQTAQIYQVQLVDLPSYVNLARTEDPTAIQNLIAYFDPLLPIPMTNSDIITTIDGITNHTFALNWVLAQIYAAIDLGTITQYSDIDTQWPIVLATYVAPTKLAARTTSTLSLSLVGTGATGTQINATKASNVKLNVSTSTTATIGGASTSLVALKICATNNATEANWTTVATLENDQNVTLAVLLQSVQVLKGQLCADLPAGWYVKLVNSGTGTHTEAFVSGQQTVYSS